MIRILRFASADITIDIKDILKNERSIKRIESLSFIESNRLNRFLMSNFSLKNLGIIIALNLGLRIGEICSLKWSDIDLQRGSIAISKSMQRIYFDKEKHTKIIVQMPKTFNSIREIPIPNFLLKILKSIKGESGYYLLSGKSEKFVEPRNLERHFNLICQKIIKRKIKFHDLRHTFATLAISSGVDIKTVSEILGHKSIYTTLNFYKSVSFDDKKDAILKLEKKISKYK